jgi:hypothetical protein
VQFGDVLADAVVQPQFAAEHAERSEPTFGRSLPEDRVREVRSGSAGA